MRLIKSVLIILTLFSACNKKKDFLDIKILGHAGMGLSIQNSFYHDNSLESIDLALSMDGCDGVEVDVQMSKDNTLWLYHDPFLENQTNLSGCIADKNNDELSNAKYKSMHKEKLIRLDEIDFNKLQNKFLLLDIRHFNNCLNTSVNINDFVASLIALNLSSEIKIRVILKNSSWINNFTNSGFEVIYEAFDLADWNNTISIYQHLKGLIIKNADITKTQLNEVKTNQKEVYLFEMRAPKSIKKALLKKPDAIITDDLRASILEKY